MSTSIRLYRDNALRPGRIGIFPGAFNPVTRAHLAVARGARDQHQLDQVVFLLPRNFPHEKEYEGTTLEERVALLEDAVDNDSTLAVASIQGGLFIEIAREFRAECGDAGIHLICGRDAAERIVRWDYGDGPSFAEQLEEFQMLVASRESEYVVPPDYAGRMHLIRMPATFSEISSTSVREAIQAGGPWEDLVPAPVARQIHARQMYQS